MEFGLCHPSGARSFEVAPKFLENKCTAEIDNRQFIERTHINNLMIPDIY